MEQCVCENCLYCPHCTVSPTEWNTPPNWYKCKMQLNMCVIWVMYEGGLRILLHFLYTITNLDARSLWSSDMYCASQMYYGVTPRMLCFFTMHCSLRLNVRSELDVPTFATRHLHVCHHVRAPSGGRWNCGRETSA